MKLWNFDALLSSPDNAKGALLSTLSSHTKSVNVVRWSKDGKYLASGSDDNYILIHKYTPGAISNQTFGSSSAAVKNKETWTRYIVVLLSLIHDLLRAFALSLNLVPDTPTLQMLLPASSLDGYPGPGLALRPSRYRLHPRFGFGGQPHHGVEYTPAS